MIGFIHGQFASLDMKTKKIFVDVQGVGYEVYLHNRDLTTLTQKGTGTDVFVYTCQLIRQENWELYGFLSQEERQVFGDLLSVNGVGAKMAITLLGFSDLVSLSQAVLGKQVAFFKAVPGVGPKLANRIILELENKVQKWPTDAQASKTAVSDTQPLEDLRSTLANLGYGAPEVEPLIQQALRDEDFTQCPFEEKVRYMLQKLSARKQRQDRM